MIKHSMHYIKAVIIGCIGGLVGVFMVVLLHAVMNQYNNKEWLGDLIASGGTVRYLLDIVVAFSMAVLFSIILYSQNGKKRPANQERTLPIEKGMIYSPLQGQVIPIEEVPDDTFAAKVLGDGMAVIPAEGTVYAPFDGRVEKVYAAKHVVGISSIDGIEILIHVGISTEESEEDFFESLVSEGDEFQRGDILLWFDIVKMKEGGYSTVTPIIVTNSDDYDVIQLLGNGMVDPQDILMKVCKR